MSDRQPEKSFIYLNIAQGLGAFNDNAFKILTCLLALSLVKDPAASGRWIALASGVFVAPFLLFSLFAGSLADRFSKRSILVVMKFIEIFIMLSAMAAFYSQKMEIFILTLFLLGVHSTFFSPAKYGILPEITAPEKLSMANGVIELCTFLAILLGTVFGSFALDLFSGNLAWIGICLLTTAVLGTLASLGIQKTAPLSPGKPLRWNVLSDVAQEIKFLKQSRTLSLGTLGIAYFWFLGAMLQLNTLLYGKEILGVSQMATGGLLVAVALGAGAGSVLAGRISGARVELGLVPLGAIGMSVFALDLAFGSPSYLRALVDLTLLGCAGGLFIVPLNTLIQVRSPAKERGRTIATTNFFAFCGIFLASALMWLFRDPLGMTPAWIFGVMGLATIGTGGFIVALLPDWLVRLLLLILTHSLYRIKTRGVQNVPADRGALLVCNHVSFVDGLLIIAAMPRQVRFIIDKAWYEAPFVRWFCKILGAIPMPQGEGPKGIIRSLQSAREAVEKGDLVCIFAEGQITRTGNLQPFKEGFGRIVKNSTIPIIPVYMDRVWGSIFSFERRKFVWKKPSQWPYPITICIGEALPAETTARQVRDAVAGLATEAFNLRKQDQCSLVYQFIRAAKSRWFRDCLADSSGTRITYGRTLVASILLARIIKRRCEEKMIGILLPPTVAGAITNIAVSAAGKVPVNLNYTALGSLEGVGRQCDLKTVLTSKIFLRKLGAKEPVGAVYVEDLMKQIPSIQKLLWGIFAFVLPRRVLARVALAGNRRDVDELATIIFSSGSTGEPKGVMLSHFNIISNIEGLAQVFSFRNDDAVIGVLPLFHSFGFTITLWMPLLLGIRVVYHPNPIEAQAIGELTEKHRGTILLATPTFLSAYTRRCSVEQLRTLRYVIVGAEKLRDSVANAFAEKFGVWPLEGYGATELSPVVSVNVPDVTQGEIRQVGQKRGTVGELLPGISVRIVNPDTHAELPAGQEGLLLVRGPNVMQGYLGRPDLTAQVLEDGWYVTGDIATVDEGGFLTITDRLSRFSKIGGEMVPHIKVEEKIQEILGDAQPSCAVTAIADEKRGERLAVLYTGTQIQAREIWDRLMKTDLPKLWIPKAEDFYRVDELPILGSGKLDLKKIKARVEEMDGRNKGNQ